MELILGAGGLVLAGIAVVVAAVVALIIFLIMKAWIKVARADEALVVSGKRSGSKEIDSNVNVIVNGRALVNPLTQRHEIISLRSRQVSMRAEAQSRDGVTLNVDAVGLVKIGSSEEAVRLAAERFASQDKAIEVFTTDQLEGALRGVVAQLPVTELMRDRKKFSDEIATDISGELARQGLHLDSFQIRSITDGSGYIASLGAPEIAAKRQLAQVADTNADRAVRKQQLENEEANLIEQTEFDKNTENAAAEVGRARAVAEQAEELARAEARQQVLTQEAENTQAQLDSQVRRVADADRYKREQESEAKAFEQQKRAEAEAFETTRKAEADTRIAEEAAKALQHRAGSEAEAQRMKATAGADAERVKALAEAEAIRARGEAKATAIEAEAEALSKHQDAIIAQRAIEALPQLMQEFARGYANVGEITLIGGSSETTSAGAVVAGEQATALRGVFDSVRVATGLDLASIIQGRVVGEAAGQGFAAGAEKPTTRRAARQSGDSADSGAE